MWVLASLILIIVLLIVRYFYQQTKVWVKIIQSESFITEMNNVCYIVLNVIITNPSNIPLNSITFTSIPNYPFKTGINKNIPGYRRISGGAETGGTMNVLTNIIDATIPQTIKPKYKLKGYLIIRNETEVSKIEKLITNLHNRLIETPIHYNKLNLRAI